MDDWDGTPLEEVSEDSLQRLRKFYGARLASRIEQSIQEVPYPQSDLVFLTGDGMPSHVRYVMDVLYAGELRDEEEIVNAVCVAANETIAREIDRICSELEEVDDDE